MARNFKNKEEFMLEFVKIIDVLEKDFQMNLNEIDGLLDSCDFEFRLEKACGSPKWSNYN